jgi:hypothetical protein
MMICYPETKEALIGKIEYLNSKGMVVDSTEYDDEEQFIQDIKDELDWGVPIVITLYIDKKGKTIPTDFIYDLDCLPKGFKRELAPA